MSTIVTDGLISLGVVLSLWLIYVISQPAVNNKAVEHLMRFNELARRNHLSITKHEILGDIIIGLDSRQKQILILKYANGQYDHKIVNINEIMNFSIKEIYREMPVGEYTQPSQHTLLLDKIVLECSFTGNGKHIQIPFYVSANNQLIELPEILRKLKKWELRLKQVECMQQQHSVHTNSC